MEFGTKAEKDELQRILGIGEGIAMGDIEAFRVLLRETGALDACIKQAREATEKGLSILPELKKHLTEEAFQFLSALSEYLLERKS
jgi:geranylgeranyl pyrophosphate synthase